MYESPRICCAPLMRRENSSKRRTRFGAISKFAPYVTRDVLGPHHRAPINDRISTYHFADVLSDLLTGDDMLAPCSSGLGLEIFLLALRLRTGQRHGGRGGHARRYRDAADHGRSSARQRP